MLNIALPKGRLGDKVFGMLSKIGYDCPEMHENSRKLVFENPENNVRYLLIKPSDVCTYVERGAADIGIVGKDTLIEAEADVYELLDLDIGKCRVACAAPAGFSDDQHNILKVATKYPNIAKKYYQSINREIEIIKLNGSVELAPLIGLSDVIIDIVETGTTIIENGLFIYKDNIAAISARLIANKSSYKFKSDYINDMVQDLREALNDDKNIK